MQTVVCELGAFWKQLASDLDGLLDLQASPAEARGASVSVSTPNQLTPHGTVVSPLPIRTIEALGVPSHPNCAQARLAPFTAMAAAASKLPVRLVSCGVGARWDALPSSQGPTVVGGRPLDAE